jgi:hypothetical protein
MEKKLSKQDYFFITLLVVTGIVLSVIIYLPRRTSGDYVEVRVDGNVTATYPLDTDRTETIEPDGGTNTFQIKDGSVTMTDADCHDHTCVKTTSISRNGETIVCLPHKVVLEVITKENRSSDIDAVTGGVQ